MYDSGSTSRNVNNRSEGALPFKDTFLGKAIDYLGFLSIGIFCLCYSVFVANFAELHISSPFLSFPIFVGEILLGFCLLLFFIKSMLQPVALKIWHYGVLLYVVWVLAKAFWGYFTFGPLAFRNAALFYYPLFALLGYRFYRGDLFHQKTIMLLLLILMLVKSTIGFSNYYIFPATMICVVLVSKIKGPWIRFFFLVPLVYIYAQGNFFHDSKTTVIGNIAGFLFLAYGLSLLTVRLNRKQRIIALCFVGLLLGLALLKYGNKNQIKSLTTPLDVIRQFKQIDSDIERGKKNYTPRPLSVDLYKPERVEFSDSVFLRTQSLDWPLADADKEGLKGIKEEMIIGQIDKNAQLARIAVIQIVKGLQENYIVDFKDSFKSLDEQRRAIGILEGTVDYVVRKASDVIEQKRKFAIENVKSFFEQQRTNPVSAREVRTTLERLSTISAVEPTNGAVSVVYAQRRLLLGVIRTSAMAKPKQPRDIAGSKSVGSVLVAPKESPFVSNEEKKTHPDIPDPKGVASLLAVLEKVSLVSDENKKHIDIIFDAGVAEKQIASAAVEGLMFRTDDRKKEMALLNDEVSSGSKEDRMAEEKNTSLEVAPGLAQEGPALAPEKTRPLCEEYGNMIFRLLVWRDMMRELFAQPGSPVLGVNFGKPQRSVSIEVIRAAYGEWMRDGWITSHNSYLDMIYRGGIVGFFMVLGLFAFAWRLFKRFVSFKSTAGIFLLSALVYWLIISNFLTVLELPQHAIPFWSLLGMTLAYGGNLGASISADSQERMESDNA